MVMPVKNYFTLKEQQCPCCGGGKFAPDFLDQLNYARALSDIPFVVNSGFRCNKHNLEIGGSPTSSHLIGCACDIRCLSNYEREVILECLFQAKFKRIGIGSNFIHCDNDFTKPQNVVWLYK